MITVELIAGPQDGQMQAVPGTVPPGELTVTLGHIGGWRIWLDRSDTLGLALRSVGVYRWSGRCSAGHETYQWAGERA